ncbi:MAG: succinate dehydrogenase cytochrome b subunit [Nitrospirae bacterium]|nr:succinate dehydrogenase cytochrome b subunit [Nitrospirota bacterium]
MYLLKNSVGRKIIMSVTGFTMLTFVIVHLVGNASIYDGPDGINTYAAALHHNSTFLLAVRLTLLGFCSLHVFFGTLLTLRNNAAKPQGYAVNKSLSATFASKNMIWTGLLVAVFIIYHLLHFTFQVTNPEISAFKHLDAKGRHDVFTMIVLSFRHLFIALAYVCGVGILGLHLSHGIQSSIQTVGLNSRKIFPFILKSGMILWIIIFLGFSSFPIAILTGIFK